MFEILYMFDALVFADLSLDLKNEEKSINIPVYT